MSPSSRSFAWKYLLAAILHIGARLAIPSGRQVIQYLKVTSFGILLHIPKPITAKLSTKCMTVMANRIVRKTSLSPNRNRSNSALNGSVGQYAPMSRTTHIEVSIPTTVDEGGLYSFTGTFLPGGTYDLSGTFSNG